MSEGNQQQRVLDLIDDPNALEKFLGGLTSDSELLPSAESVDNVVASLARSLEADYEVDSPNETLFDTLESNNLTDISQSYVPSDFENAIATAAAGVQTQGFTSNTMGSISVPNGDGSSHTVMSQQNLQASLCVSGSGVQQYLMTSTNNATTINTNTSIQQQQFSSTSSTTSQFMQNIQDLSIQDLLRKDVIPLPIPSLSTSSQQQQNNSNFGSGLNQTISISSNNSTSASTLAFSSATRQQLQQRQTLSNQIGLSTSNNVTSNSGTSNGNELSVSNSNVSPLTSENNTPNNSSIVKTSTSAIMQPQSQFVTTTNQQPTTISQLVSATGQTVNLANVTMGGTQLIATSAGNIVTAGPAQTSIIQQIQTNGGQGYITVDQPTALIAGPAFGGANLALVATGASPAYAVVNTGPQFLSNAIMQPQTIQTLAKGPGGTYIQTAGGAQLVQTSGVSQIQNVNVSVANNPNSSNNKPKQPPQLLPKPQGGTGNQNAEASTEGNTSTTPTTSVASSNPQSIATSTANTDGLVTHQIIQQAQPTSIQSLANQVVVTSMGNTMIPQHSFSIGGTGIGQVVMSQNAASQGPLTGTIVVNQYGQPMIVPTAGQPGLQFIVRPQNPPMLTLQAPAGGSQMVGGKPVVRYVSQVPQMAQTSGYGLQQIQTPNGPAWVAVRYPQAATTTLTTATTVQGDVTQHQTQTPIVFSSTPQSQQNVTSQSQPQTPQAPVMTPSSQPTPTTPTPKPPQIQVQTAQTPEPVRPASASGQPSTPRRSSTPATQDQTPDSSCEPPPAKKAKPRSRSKKNNNNTKVTLDLEQLLKQSGIMDEDLQDDSFDFGFGSQDFMTNGMDDFSQTSMDTQNSVDSVQDPGIGTSDNSKTPTSSKKKSSNSRKKKNTVEKPKTPPPPTPPPPPPPKSKSKKKSGTQKAENKTETSSPFSSSSKTSSPFPSATKTSSPFSSASKSEPKKTSSIDDIWATIQAVASASGSSPSPPSSPAPPRPPAINIDHHKDSSNSIDDIISSVIHGSPDPAPETSAATPAPSVSSVTSDTQPVPSVPSVSNVMNPSSANPVQVPISTQTVTSTTLTQTPVSTPAPGVLPNGMTNAQVIPAMPTTPPQGTRVVQTIQLTPQNQQLLRNIQAQITRLLKLPVRNDTEQTALQKLIVLQQQVIATGIPVPTPSHLNNLAQNVSSTLLPASTAPSVAPTTGDSVSTSNANNILTATSLSHTTATTNHVKILPKLAPTPTTTATPSTDASNSNSINDLDGSFKEAMSNILANDTSSSAETSDLQTTKTTQDNKENASGNSQVVVTTSPLPSGTTTTTALGPNIQSFPVFKSSPEDKKAEEQRLANLKIEEEKRARWKKEEFEMLLKRDQQCVLKADYDAPFTSKRDAVERLMRYHILRDRNDMNFEEFDNEFGEKSGVLLDKFHGMLAKYRGLLLKESMKEVGSAERVMLERMFVSEEKMKLEQDRLLVGQGEIIELPPPPQTWISKIQEMVDHELREMEQNSYCNMQTQSAIDSIIGFGNMDSSSYMMDDNENKIEYDAFGVPLNSNGSYNGLGASSADIDEAVRSILS